MLAMFGFALITVVAAVCGLVGWFRSRRQRTGSDAAVAAASCGSGDTPVTADLESKTSAADATDTGYDAAGVAVTAADDTDFRPTSQHQGTDWADLGFGPNRKVTGPTPAAPTRAAVATRFVLDEKVAQKFNAYATAAWPSEIGGLLKLDESEPGVVRAVDIKIFSHKVAHGTYWEADPVDVAKFMMELDATGRGDEIAQWRCLIHSHPNMSPFLSGTDRENVVRLAGTTNAWSVICAAKNNPDGNRFAVHYAQSGPIPMVVTDLTVHSDGGTLSGVELLTDDEIAAIDADVAAVLSTARSPYQPGGWSPAASSRLKPASTRAAAPARSDGGLLGVWEDEAWGSERWDTSVLTVEDLEQIPGHPAARVKDAG